MTRPQPRRCPVCGKQHSDPVTFTCWACITSDVKDDSLIEPPADPDDTQPVTPLFEESDDV